MQIHLQLYCKDLNSLINKFNIFEFTLFLTFIGTNFLMSATFWLFKLFRCLFWQLFIFFTISSSHSILKCFLCIDSGTYSTHTCLICTPDLPFPFSFLNIQNLKHNFITRRRMVALHQRRSAKIPVFDINAKNNQTLSWLLNQILFPHIVVLSLHETLIQYCLVVDFRYFVANLTHWHFLKWPKKGFFWICFSVS